METAREERSWQERSLLFALPGAAQGYAFWALIEASQNQASSSIFACMIALVAAPFAFFFTAGRTRAELARAGAFALALGTALGGLARLEIDPADEGTIAVAVLASLLIAAVAVPFFRTWAEAGTIRSYRVLFDQAFGLPVVAAVSGAFVGGVWLLSWLVAALFAVIGLDALTRLLGEPVFALPFTFAVAAVAISVVREREGVLLALRGLLFALLRVVAPVLAVAVVAFAVALLFQGLGSLWEGLSPVACLTGTAAACVLFVNAAIGAEGRPAPLGRASALALCLVVPVLMGLAAWGMAVRLDAQGLTPERFYASVIVGVASLYAVAYAAAAALGGRWRVVRRANVLLALLAVVLAALIETPLVRPVAWSAASQEARLASGRVLPGDFDFAYLAHRLGEPGREVLARIEAAGGEAARLASAARAEESYYRAREAQRSAALSQDDLVERGRLVVLPVGVVLDQDLLRQAAPRGAREAGDGARAGIILPDGQDGTTAWVLRPRDAAVYLTVLRREPTGWTSVYAVSQPLPPGTTGDALLDALPTLAVGRTEVTVAAPTLGDLVLHPVSEGDRDALAGL